MQSLKINVSKIDKEALYTGKNGKYLDLVLFTNKEGPDQYGNDGFVVQDLPKSRRDAGERGPIIGNWKNLEKKSATAERPKHSAEATYRRPDPLSKEGLAQQSLDPNDDVPF